jgi:hypothetical protein
VNTKERRERGWRTYYKPDTGESGPQAEAAQNSPGRNSIDAEEEAYGAEEEEEAYAPDSTDYQVEDGIDRIDGAGRACEAEQGGVADRNAASNSAALVVHQPSNRRIEPSNRGREPSNRVAATAGQEIRGRDNESNGSIRQFALHVESDLLIGAAINKGRARKRQLGTHHPTATGELRRGGNSVGGSQMSTTYCEVHAKTLPQFVRRLRHAMHLPPNWPIALTIGLQQLVTGADGDLNSSSSFAFVRLRSLSQLVDAPAVNGLKVRRSIAGGRDEKEQVRQQVEDLMTLEHEARRKELVRTGEVRAAAVGAGQRMGSEDREGGAVAGVQQQREQEWEQRQRQQELDQEMELAGRRDGKELVIAPAPPPQGEEQQRKKKKQRASGAGRGARAHVREGHEEVDGRGGAIVRREELVDYFALYNPAKIGSVNKLLSQFQGPEREGKLCELLLRKYGEAPPLQMDRVTREKVELIKTRLAREEGRAAGGGRQRSGGAGEPSLSDVQEMERLKKELAEVKQQLKQQVLGGAQSEVPQESQLPGIRGARAPDEEESVQQDTFEGRRGSNASSNTSSNYQKYGVSMRRGSFYQAPWDGMGEGSGDMDCGSDDGADGAPPMPPRDASEDEDEEREGYERMMQAEEASWDVEGQGRGGGQRGGRGDVTLTVEELGVYFRLYNPSKVANARKLLHSFKGRQGKLCDMLEEKYGVHPLDALPDKMEDEKRGAHEKEKRVSKLEMTGARHIKRERAEKDGAGENAGYLQKAKSGTRRASFSTAGEEQQVLGPKQAAPIVDEYLDTLCTFVGLKPDEESSQPAPVADTIPARRKASFSNTVGQEEKVNVDLAAAERTTDIFLDNLWTLVSTSDAGDSGSGDSCAVGTGGGDAAAAAGAEFDENSAATMIQSKRRQQEAVKEVGEMREANTAATMIQSKRRQQEAAKEVGEMREANTAATMIQSKRRQQEAVKEVGEMREANTAATMIQSKRRQQEAAKEVAELRAGSEAPAAEANPTLRELGINAAYLFIKPHAANAEVAALVEKGLKGAGMTITQQGELDYATIDADKLIDNHYGAIAAKATKLQPSELRPSTKAQADFKQAFGLSWPEALANGEVYNATSATTKLELDTDGLDTKWSGLARGVDLIKFGGGFYAGKIEGIYVINGFYMAMRAKYTTAPAKIRFYTVEWPAETMSWGDFRGKLIGGTDPSIAGGDSLRGKVFAQWEELGLAAQPDTGDNSLHASASPFEGLAERLNWVDADLTTDPFGKRLLEAGVSKEAIAEYVQDPQVAFEGEMSSLFDLLEDTDADACCEKIVTIQAEALEINTAATMIQSKRRQQEASKEVAELRAGKDAAEAKAHVTSGKGTGGSSSSSTSSSGRGTGEGSQHELHVGDVVQAKPPDETLYFEGVVLELHADGSADIDFGDEDDEGGLAEGDDAGGKDGKDGQRQPKYTRVPKEHIRRAMAWSMLEVGDHVKARHQGGYQQFEAIIIAAHSDGTYDVQYDDEEVEERVAEDMLTKILSGRMQATRRWHKAKAMVTAMTFFRHAGTAATTPGEEAPGS